MTWRTPRLIAIAILITACSASISAQPEAVAELRAKAEQGDAEAQNTLGVMYATGEGVPQDAAEAVRWYRLAADQGYANAQNNLGVMYATGEGVPVTSPPIRHEWVEIRGTRVVGWGPPQDDAEAARWYRLAADQGHALAQYNLGVKYATGEGVPQDAAEAVRWYRLAADQGQANAQFNLGLMYGTGTGVPQDYVQAHMWFNLAALRSTGDVREDAATNRDAAASQMDPDDISEAQRLAREWDEAHPREP